MLNAFKIKEFDLEPIFAQWTDGPVFSGNPKKDMPVEEWLDKIKEGCVERGVPEEYWYKVAQHFMGPKAKARLDELKQVIVKVHGGKYRWTWKKFRIAILNMGWGIDKDAKETIKVQGKVSGLWFTRRKDSTIVLTAEGRSNTQPPSHDESSSKKPAPPTRSGSFWLPGNKSSTIVEEPEEVELPKDVPPPKPTLSRSRSTTVSSFWPARMNTTKDEKQEKELPERPTHNKTKSDGANVPAKPQAHGSKDVSPSRSHTSDGGEVVTATTQAPVWLLNACTALEYITSEHPKAMSIISAILITAGSIPTIPAIAAGAGGAVLASSAAHAIGAIAVGVGQALNAGVAHQQKKKEDQAGH